MGSPAIAVADLHKEYKDCKAVAGVSFTIEQGAFVGLLGPNGAGKTTIISILGGLTGKSSGSAQVMGHDLASAPLAARRSIGIVPQELVYDPFFKTREYLRQQSSYYGIFNNDKWIDELLDELGLTEKADTNTRALSGGMKRRLMVGLALVHQPPVVVLDEPTAGVDINLRLNLWKFIRRLNENGTTVLLTTHYLDEAEELCDRIILLNKGKVIADQPTVQLLESAGGSRLALHLRVAGEAELPGEIDALCHRGRRRQDASGRQVLELENYAQIEQVLACLRTHNLAIAEMEIAPPDLEDVFLELTSDKGASQNA
ncbi:MAG: ABC transporter ATP-binding protein [Betaproteobacteria bacterium]|nr:ABC transporter ATP-binding protein [Betaproteobacteria bacterium]